MTRATMRRAARCLGALTAAALIGVGAAGCHVGVSVHSDPGGVTHITPTPTPSHG
jgi:hypothetical protein